MTREYAEYRIKQHNDMVDNFINVKLKNRLNVIGDKINVKQLFKAWDIIKEEGLNERGRLVQRELRDEGFDVKINMQSNTLSLY